MGMRVGLERKLSTKELMLLNCGVGEDSWVPWTARRFNQSILREISPECSVLSVGKTDVEAEIPITLATWCKGLTHWKRLWCGKDWGKEEKGMMEDEMVGWHHWLNGHEFGWTLGVGDGQGGLVCCGPWGRKESDTSEWLNWTDTWYSLQVQTFPDPLSISMALQDAMSTPITGELGCVRVCVCVCVCVALPCVCGLFHRGCNEPFTKVKAPISTDPSTHIYSPSTRGGRNITTPTLQKERRKYPLPLGEGKQKMSYFFPKNF